MSVTVSLTRFCPECGAPFLDGHPAGWLVCQGHAPTCELGRAEDARAVADADLLRVTCRTQFVRHVTPTERRLFASWGVPIGPDDATLVERLTGGCAVVRRAWRWRWEVDEP